MAAGAAIDVGALRRRRLRRAPGRPIHHNRSDKEKKEKAEKEEKVWKEARRGREGPEGGREGAAKVRKGPMLWRACGAAAAPLSSKKT